MNVVTVILQRTSYEKKYPEQPSVMEKERQGSRKNPRYYKSFAVTPSEDNSYNYEQSRVDSDIHSKFTGVGGVQ